MTGGDGTPARQDHCGGASVDDLLDQAVAAINRGDRVTAAALADDVLAVDHGNAEAEDLLTAPEGGEIRRLTIVFVDLADSAMLADRGGLDTYGELISRYHDVVVRTVRRFDGYIDSPTGETLLAVFGHPVAHEDDVRRAVLAALEITGEVDRTGRSFEHRFGMRIAVRVGIHRGLVYLDTAQNDVYGLGANLAARVAGLATPGTVVVSAPIARLIGNVFELAACEPAAVKGVDELVVHYRVLGERKTADRPRPARGTRPGVGAVTTVLGAGAVLRIDHPGRGGARRGRYRKVIVGGRRGRARAGLGGGRVDLGRVGDAHRRRSAPDPSSSRRALPDNKSHAPIRMSAAARGGAGGGGTRSGV